MQSLTNSYEELITTLEKELGLLLEMVALLQTEKDVIASVDNEALDRHVSEKELVAAKVSICEEARERILRNLGLQSRSLREIAASAGPEYCDRLLFIASKFKSVTNSIAELNRLNSLLIEKSLFYIKSSRRFLETFGVTANNRVSVEA